MEILRLKQPEFQTISTSLHTTGSLGRSSVKDRNTQDEAEVIRPSCIVNLINGHIIIKNADHEGNQGDQSMPETHPEPGRVHIKFSIPCCARSQEKHCYQSNGKPFDVF